MPQFLKRKMKMCESSTKELGEEGKDIGKGWRILVQEEGLTRTMGNVIHRREERWESERVDAE